MIQIIKVPEQLRDFRIVFVGCEGRQRTKMRDIQFAVHMKSSCSPRLTTTAKGLSAEVSDQPSFFKTTHSFEVYRTNQAK